MTTSACLLRQQGLLPQFSNDADINWRDPLEDNLLPWLHEAWSRFLSECPGCSSTTRRFVNHLESLRETSAALTWGIPGIRRDQVEQSIGIRLVWWPHGVPTGDRVGIISSRIGRQLEKKRNWFAALRETCGQLDRQSAIAVTAANTSTAPFLRRCAVHFQIPLLEFSLARRGKSVVNWLQQCWKDPRDEADLIWNGLVSPALVEEPAAPGPARDRLVIDSCDKILVLHMRAGGHIEQLTRQRVAVYGSDCEISLAVGSELVADELADTFDGLTQWTPHTPAVGESGDRNADTLSHTNTIITLDQLRDVEYLTHCTRHANGPWPDQSEEDYHDALILDRVDADHGALATLARIARDRRLLSSGQAIRQGAKVVCLTSIPLEQLGAMRSFRAHRGRWDFEPYGLCIGKAWLQHLGARQVRYGDHALWMDLAPSDRPFFQQQLAGANGQIDWSVEREWRHVGDIDLAEAPSNSIWMFVPRLNEAQWLSQYTTWPIIVLEQS